MTTLSPAADLDSTARQPRRVQSLSPLDGSTVVDLPVHEPADVADTVAQARVTAQSWAALPVAQRVHHLRRWRGWMWRHRSEIVDLIHRENGKPADDGLVELVLTLEHLAWVEKNAPRLLRTRRVQPGILLANYSARVDTVALGVVGVIGPWNYPLYAPNGAVGAALAAGNTVVLKPSEYTPGVSQWYVDAFAAANPELPQGVLSLVVGFGETGAALCNAGVDKISFTGSTATGKRILAQCATTMTPAVLECGGKDPVIVAADADVAAAAEAVAWGAFTNSGQTCVGVERVYVHAAVYQPFLDALTRHAAAITPGTSRSATYGPMTMPKQVDIVRRHISDALAAGGRAVIGGIDAIDDRVIGPTILIDTPEDCSAVREETFGPTVTVRSVADVDEAVRLANDHDYALSASVFSKRNGHQIAQRLRAGQVTVNSVIAFAGMGSVPMGGVGASGFGRLHGDEGFSEFVRPRGRVAQGFAIPGFNLVTLNRRPWVMPIIDRVLALRHRG
ncbi:aldehyde dehydrogenase family protein [Williamsia sp. CHRR-6]|uniref:aldehyde dehydrogenase family protein n=1 Tax=Williamsia sp. CHRR-6 TaxID=2835871 RepID=UPI001BDAAAD9|nr:aldehyde dehydrogenase family protein [Williamsia sp. CHRR-6]MBT0567254.1 aldehyde dehydrogenase family protein [Williamsia sp. CHRR-6]